MNERDEAEAKARRQRCCANCVFGERLRTRWLRVILTRWPGLLICFHKAGAGGEISEVTACSVCPNFRARRAPTVQSAPRESSDPAIRYISLTRGKHAIVDAADYPALGVAVQHAHNLVLDLVLWNGVPLGLLLVGALAWWAWRQVRDAQTAQQRLLLLALGLLLLHALLELPHLYAFFLLPAAAMAGGKRGCGRASWAGAP